MDKPNVLMLLDTEDAKIVPQTNSDKWNLFWKILNYKEIISNFDELKKIVTTNNIDFIMFSRNDQVADRIKINPLMGKLNVGVSSFSGIDNDCREKQMLDFFNDFIKCNKLVSLNCSKKYKKTTENSKVNGTFSIIFDAEQLGCFRYGIPRILEILDEYGIKGTFFVTNVMKKVYSNAITELSEGGHEVGIHGKWHENLSGLDVSTQTKMVGEMRSDFDNISKGANLIGRMDNSSVSALASNDFRYFLYLPANAYSPFGYPIMPDFPFSLTVDEGKIFALPISINTYCLPWFAIKNLINSAYSRSKNGESPHLTILLHPFRDGSLDRIETTRKIIKYLLEKLDLTPITLEDYVDNICSESNLPHITYEELSKLTIPKRILRRPRTKQDLVGATDLFVKLYKKLRKNREVF